MYELKFMYSVPNIYIYIARWRRMQSNFEDTKGVFSSSNRRTDNTMDKRKKIKHRSTKIYTEN